MAVNLSDENAFRDALHGLNRGDFSRLAPLFENKDGGPPLIVQWVQNNYFLDHERELAEALTCACFHGRVEAAEYLLDQGVAPSGGIGTGLNAIHWAANRGQLEAVRLLIRHRVPLESLSMYGGTALGTAVYAAVNEPRTEHHRTIIEELLAAGARISESGYPTGDQSVDSLLRRHGAS